MTQPGAFTASTGDAAQPVLSIYNRYRREVRDTGALAFNTEDAPAPLCYVGAVAHALSADPHTVRCTDTSAEFTYLAYPSGTTEADMLTVRWTGGGGWYARWPDDPWTLLAVPALATPAEVGHHLHLDGPAPGASLEHPPVPVLLPASVERLRLAGMIDGRTAGVLAGYWPRLNGHHHHLVQGLEWRTWPPRDTWRPPASLAEVPVHTTAPENFAVGDERRRLRRLAAAAATMALEARLASEHGTDAATPLGAPASRTSGPLGWTWPLTRAFLDAQPGLGERWAELREEYDALYARLQARKEDWERGGDSLAVELAWEAELHRRAREEDSPGRAALEAAPARELRLPA